MDEASLLAVEIGNAETTMGLFAGDRLAATWTITTAPHLTPDEALAAFGAFAAAKQVPTPESAIICSVVPALTETWAHALGELCGQRPLTVGPGLKSGIAMGYKDPGQLGGDRVACAVAAKALAGAPVTIVDFGSATTITVVDEDGKLLGGTIAPGLAVSMDALDVSAAQLTETDLRPPSQVIGRTTADAIRAGVVLGEAVRADGLVEAIWQELGYRTPLVATGRHAQTVCSRSRLAYDLQPALALSGLRIIWDANRKR